MNLSNSNEETEEQKVWRVLSEAGLVEIRLDEFAERIRDVKRIVVGRLRELLISTTVFKNANLRLTRWVR